MMFIKVIVIVITSIITLWGVFELENYFSDRKYINELQTKFPTIKTSTIENLSAVAPNKWSFSDCYAIYRADNSCIYRFTFPNVKEFRKYKRFLKKQEKYQNLKKKILMNKDTEEVTKFWEKDIEDFRKKSVEELKKKLKENTIYEYI